MAFPHYTPKGVFAFFCTLVYTVYIQVRITHTTFMQTKYTVRVTGTAKANTPLKNFEVSNIWTDDGDFVEYMRDGELKDKLVGESYLTFELVGRSLISVVEYNTNVKLTKSELKQLGDYTQGQWSDGIGEGFEQNPCGTTNSGKDLYISPWHYDQVINVEQVKN